MSLTGGLPPQEDRAVVRAVDGPGRTDHRRVMDVAASVEFDGIVGSGVVGGGAARGRVGRSSVGRALL